MRKKNRDSINTPREDLSLASTTEIMADTAHAIVLTIVESHCGNWHNTWAYLMLVIRA